MVEQATTATAKEQTAENGISIGIDNILDGAISKILIGEKNVVIYITEKVARKIAAAVLEERAEIESIPITDMSNGEVLCQVNIEILYSD